MSLRTRITLAAAIAVAAVAVVLGAIGYFPTRAQLVGQIRQQLQQRAAPFLTIPTRDRGQHDHGQTGGVGGGAGACLSTQHEHVPAAALGGAPGYFQSVCPDGRVIADEGGTPALPVTKRVLQIAKRARGSFYFAATVRDTHVEILAVGDTPDRKAIEVALPLTPVDVVLDKLLVTYLILVGVGIVLAGVVGLLIARAAVAPILRFSAKTEKATSSLDRPQRLEETGAPELRRLAASFNQTLDALERSVHAQRHLIADASHELRTPMAALRSNIQIFLDAERLPEHERRELQDAILAELDELTQLVVDVLELARGSTPSEQTEPVELDGLIRDAVDRTRRRSPSTKFELDIEPTVINNSSERVSRAVINVIDNARKWNPDDGAIEVSLRNGVLTVRDHGPGFAEGDLEHVFDRFYRSDHARRMPGSGLGLAIVKQAAEVHGGSAVAVNAPDGGAILRVSFGPSAAAEKPGTASPGA
jgi:two-component system, OmpR family, sensor histidine kinase MprB